MAIIKGHTFDVVKKLGQPQELLDSIKYQTAKKGDNKVLIGHNRWATTGKVNVANAHPFIVDDVIIGVHNGTLENKYDIDPQREFETDSEALYDNIHRLGTKAAVAKVRGAYALVWWDDETETLNFLRNYQRPLAIGFTKDDKTMYWASEAWMLHCLPAREGVTLERIFELPVDTHIQYKIPKLGTESIVELARMDVTCAPPFRNIIIQGGEVGKTTSTQLTQGSTKERINALVGKYFTGKAGLVVHDGNSVYIRYIVKDHYIYEFRVYYPNANIAHQHANKEETLHARYVVSQNNWPKYISCEIIPAESEEHEEVDAQRAFEKEAFEKLHKQCAWCDDPLVFEGDWHVSSAGICVCGGCAKLKEVKEFLNLD